jgi:membrane-bound lytic murein transglycosylase D
MSDFRLSSVLRPVLYVAGALFLVGVLLSIQGFTGSQGGIEAQEHLAVLNQPVAIPDHLDFAGEAVPLVNFDTRESLDKELLVNAYWHSHTIMLLKKSKRYFGIIEPILKKYGVPDDFKYMAMAESGFENVVSPAKAVGVWQLLESSAKEFGLEVNENIDERYDLAKSTEAACKYLLKSYEEFGNWTMAAATYNVGRIGLKNQLEKQKVNNYYDLLLNDETARYIFRLISLKLITENPQAYGLNVQENDYYPVIETHEVMVNKEIPNIADFALANGTNYKIIKQFNPWMRQNFLPCQPGKEYHVIIPNEGQREIQ